MSKEQRNEIIQKFRTHASDTGSPQVQIALATARLAELNAHFRTNTKDHHSRRGLMKIVSHRRSLMNYLNRKDPEAYKKLITELQIRG
jgi:small subunit ribosomal protein S15